MSSATRINLSDQLLQPVRLAARTLVAVLAAIVLQIETALFILGLHPGYIIHRLNSPMRRLTSIFGFRNDNRDDASGTDGQGGTRGKIVKRSRQDPGLRRRKAAISRVDEQGKQTEQWYQFPRTL